MFLILFNLAIRFVCSPIAKQHAGNKYDTSFSITYMVKIAQQIDTPCRTKKLYTLLAGSAVSVFLRYRKANREYKAMPKIT